MLCCVCVSVSYEREDEFDGSLRLEMAQKMLDVFDSGA